MTEVLRLPQRVDDEVWWVEVDRHLDEQHRGRRTCTNYEQGVIGSELWAVGHQQRIRLEIDQREVARTAQRKNRTWWAAASVASVSACATAGGDSRGIDQKSIGKAHWARARAASLWQQADDLDRNHSGDWRARATRRRAAARLRTEAHRFESTALRLDPELAEEAA